APLHGIGRSRRGGDKPEARAEQDGRRSGRNGYSNRGAVVSASCRAHAADERQAKQSQPGFHALVSNVRGLSCPAGARSQFIQKVRLTVKRNVERGSKKLIR